MIRRVLIVILGLGLSLSAARSETERTIRAELSGADAANFAIENLAGRMRVTASSVDRVTVVARVVAESAELADAVRVERVADGGSAATLRVRYPYDKVKTFRYDNPDHDRDWPFDRMNSSRPTTTRAERRSVNEGRGTRLWVDLEVQVPAGRRQASFRNLVGRIEAEGLEGTLRFDVGSADLRLRKLDGDITLEGDSGDIRASDIRGSWVSDFASGDCRLDELRGPAVPLPYRLGRPGREGRSGAKHRDGDQLGRRPGVVGRHRGLSGRGRLGRHRRGRRRVAARVVPGEDRERGRLPRLARGRRVRRRSGPVERGHDRGLRGGDRRARRRGSGRFPARDRRRPDPGHDLERGLFDLSALKRGHRGAPCAPALELSPSRRRPACRRATTSTRSDGVLDHLADRLVRAGNLVDDARVLAALDAFGLPREILPRETAPGLAAGHPAARAVRGTLERLGVAEAPDDEGALCPSTPG